MLAPRRLWTGPPGAAIRDRLLAELGPEPAGALDRAHAAGPRPGRAGRLAGRSRGSGPGLAGLLLGRSLADRPPRGRGRAALALADGGPRGLSRGDPAGAGAGPLHRDRTAWSSSGDTGGGSPSGSGPGRLPSDRPRHRQRRRDPGNPVELAEEAIFVLYRALLKQLGAEDEAGMTVWASKRLAQQPPVLGPVRRFRSRRLPRFRPSRPGALENPRAGAQDRASRSTSRSPTIPIPHWRRFTTPRNRPPGATPREGLRGDAGRARGRAARGPAPGRATASSGTSPPASNGHRVGDGPGHPGSAPGRGSRPDPGPRGPLQLRATGVAPEEILIVYRHWSDEAELALETLRAWGLPAHAERPQAASGRAGRLPPCGWRSRSRWRTGKPS